MSNILLCIGLLLGVVQTIFDFYGIQTYIMVSAIQSIVVYFMLSDITDEFKWFVIKLLQYVFMSAIIRFLVLALCLYFQTDKMVSHTIYNLISCLMPFIYHKCLSDKNI